MKQSDWQARLKHVENWHVVTKKGVAHVGSPERLLIVDESPPRSGQKVLGGEVGARLADLFGFRDSEELLEHVDAIYLLPRCPGKTKTGKVLFPMRTAKREWNRFRFEAGGVVLLGRIGKMMGLRPLTQVETDYPSRAFAFPDLRGAWWDEKQIVRRARKALEPWATFARTGKWS